MLGLFGIHEIAARRGDGLRPECLGLRSEESFCERLTITPVDVSDAGQRSLASDTRREPLAARSPSPQSMQRCR